MFISICTVFTVISFPQLAAFCPQFIKEMCYVMLCYVMLCYVMLCYLSSVGVVCPPDCISQTLGLCLRFYVQRRVVISMLGS